MSHSGLYSWTTSTGWMNKGFLQAIRSIYDRRRFEQLCPVY